MERSSRRQFVSAAVAAIAGASGCSEGNMGSNDKGDENDGLQGQNAEELADGDWAQNIRFHHPVEGLELSAPSVSSRSGTLESTVELTIAMEMREPRTVSISGLRLAFRIGEDVADIATISLDGTVIVSGENNCDFSNAGRFYVEREMSGIQGADELLVTLREQDVEVTEDCSRDSTDMPSETDTPTEGGDLQPPEPRFVVAQDGSGDYESLGDARRAARDGDVIELKEGSYTFRPETEDPGASDTKSLTLVGADRTTTTVTVDAERNELRLSETDYTFWDLTVEGSGNQYLFPSGNCVIRAYRTRYRLPTHGWIANGNLNSRLKIRQSVVNPPTVSKDAIQTTKYEGLAEIPVHVGRLDAEECTFQTPVTFNSVSAHGCRFEETVTLPDGVGGQIDRSDLLKGVELHADDGSDLVIADSELHPDADEYAFRIPEATGSYATSDEFRYHGPTIRNSDIYGRIDDTKKDRVWKSVKRLEGNVFRAEEIDADYFIDGKGAIFVHRNAFLGADIRIDAPDVNVYDEGRELGNYYSTFDEDDEDGDGIIDLPRPIPGEGEHADQYPLASNDVGKYD